MHGAGRMGVDGGTPVTLHAPGPGTATRERGRHVAVLGRLSVVVIVVIASACGERGTAGNRGAALGPSVVQPPPPPPPPPEPPVARAPACPAGAPEGALLLSHALHGTHGALFSETIRVSCSGQVDRAAPAPFGGSEVGAYRLALSPAELEVVRRLAADLLAERYTVPSLPPQGVDASVTVHTEPPLTRDVRNTPAQRAAAAWFAGVRTRSLQSPLAAFDVRLRAQQRPTFPSPTIVVDFVHRGPQPLDLKLDTGAIMVRLQPAGAALSESNAEPRMGLLDARGALLDGDGISRAATLSQGNTVSLVLPVLPSRGHVEVSVSLSGHVELPGSGSSGAGAGAGAVGTIGPGTPFRVASEPVQIEFPP